MLNKTSLFVFTSSPSSGTQLWLEMSLASVVMLSSSRFWLLSNHQGVGDLVLHLGELNLQTNSFSVPNISLFL